MQITDTDYDGLVVRLAKLERQNRVWKMAGLLTLLTTVVLLTGNIKGQQAGDSAPRPERLMQYGAKTPQTTTVEARTYLLKDSAGVLRGKMTVDGDRHPVLEFYDLDGNVTWSTDPRAIPTR
jgi:hypothetical protein